MPKLAPVPCQLIGQLTDLIILFLYNLGQMLVLLLGLFQGPMVHFPETGQFRIQLIALLEKHHLEKQTQTCYLLKNPLLICVDPNVKTDLSFERQGCY